MNRLLGSCIAGALLALRCASAHAEEPASSAVATAPPAVAAPPVVTPPAPPLPEPPSPPPPAPSATTALVHLDADLGVGLEIATGRRTWKWACFAPCDKELPVD